MAADADESSTLSFGRELLESLPVVAFEVDREGRILPGACGGAHPRRDAGWAIRAGESASAVFGSNARIVTMLDAAIAGGVRSTLDVPLDDRLFQVATSPRFDAEGAIVGVSVLAIDVTDAREAKSALTARDAQLRLLVDTALDAVVTCDVNSTIVDWNSGAERLFGWSRDEAVGMSLTETVVPEDLRAAHNAGMKRFLATGEGPVLGRRIEIEAVDRSGRRFPIELAINPIPTPSGMLFSAFLRDISSRIDAERRLAGSEYRLRSALDAMRAGAWDLQLDSDGRVAEAESDDRAIELLGEDAMRLPAARNRVHPDDRELVARAWVSHLSGYEPRYDIEYRVVDDEGTIGWRRDLGMLVDVEDVDGAAPEFAGRVRRPRRVIGVVTDVTGAHDMAQSLAAARKLEAVGQVASSFAHDLNNVLAAVLGHAALASTLPDLPVRAKRSLETIREAVTRGRTFTQNMLMLGRPGRARRNQVDPAKIIADTERLARPILGEDMELAVDLEAELPRIECDGNQFQQAILNVLINARDATDQAGRVSIRARRTEEHDHRGRPFICVEIADDGPGMMPDVLNAATRPFFTTKGDRGTGLGLAMVDAFAGESGGRLRIESAPGAGTTIQMYLPAARGAAAPTVGEVVEGDTTPPDPSATRVLVIEDHPLLRPMLVEALANGGYDVEGVADGDAALARPLDAAPHALVVDVNLPGRRGDEVAGALRGRIGADVPVLFITGNEEFHPPPWPRIALLRKPFELHELGERIDELLRGGAD